MTYLREHVDGDVNAYLEADAHEPMEEEKGPIDVEQEARTEIMILINEHVPKPTVIDVEEESDEEKEEEEEEEEKDEQPPMTQEECIAALKRAQEFLLRNTHDHSRTIFHMHRSLSLLTAPVVRPTVQSRLDTYITTSSSSAVPVDEVIDMT